MKFSIIVPVYNAEPFLLKCLNSIFNQKFNYNFEVIAINDASTDNSLNILKKYKKNENRLVIIDQSSNTGQALARAKGMKIAQGDYIMHVDADDWLLESAFEEIHKRIEKYNPDVLILNTYVQNEGKEKVLREYFNFEGFFKKDDLDNNKVQAAFYQHSGTKVVKREITNDLIVNSDQFETTAEDFLYCIEIFFKSKNIYLFPQAYYVINIHGNSLTQITENYKKINNQILLIKLIKILFSRYKSNNAINNDILIHQERAIMHNAALSWLDGSNNKIKKKEIIEVFNSFPELKGERIENIKKCLTSRKKALHFLSSRLGFLPAVLFVIKFFTLNLLKKIKGE